MVHARRSESACTGWSERDVSLRPALPAAEEGAGMSSRAAAARSFLGETRVDREWARRVASIVFVAALGIVAFLPTAAEAVVVTTDMGTLGGALSEATAVNASGQAVGSSSTDTGQTHAFSWTQAGGMVDLGTLGGNTSGAEAVNASGEVVGSSLTATGETHAFLWTSGGGMTDIGTLGGNFSAPAAVNNSGQIVGSSANADGDRHAFSWTQAGGMGDIGPGTAAAGNDSGQGVGQTVFGGPRHAFSWTQAGGTIDLGTIERDEQSAASSLNDAGQVVGDSITATGGYDPFSWTQAGGMVDLGGLGGSGFSLATSVNDSGQVVGN